MVCAAVHKAVVTSSPDIGVHSRGSRGRGSVGWCCGIGVSSFRKNLVQKMCALASGVSASVPLPCCRGGNRHVTQPFRTAAVLQMSAASVA